MSRHTEAGPSRRQRQISDDFGPFASNTSSSSTNALGQGDLLGSFEDDLAVQPSARQVPRGRLPDLLDDEIESVYIPSSAMLQHAPGQIHVNLPPRPDEISPDFVPVRRPLRRPSQTLLMSGAGSPPLVSNAGHEIVFHPMSQQTWDDTGNIREEPTGSPIQTKLLHTLATTNKLANKWKAVLSSPSEGPHREIPDSHTQPEVTHTTPFATPEQLAGTYVAPSGAPGLQQSSTNGQAQKRSPTRSTNFQTVLRGRRTGTAEVMDQQLADDLRAFLPPRQKLSNVWSLLFSLDQHGASLATLYRFVETWASTRPGVGNILVVRDSSDRRFGCFMTEAIVKREGSYYGSGESFLFKDAEYRRQPRVFRWTGRNHYFALCETSFLSFGGGGGAYGLILDSTFTRNSSATCPAYDNEVLCTDQAIRSNKAMPFDCVGLEVWGLA